MFNLEVIFLLVIINYIVIIIFKKVRKLRLICDQKEELEYLVNIYNNLQRVFFKMI